MSERQRVLNALAKTLAINPGFVRHDENTHTVNALDAIVHRILWNTAYRSWDRGAKQAVRLAYTEYKATRKKIEESA